MSANMEKSCKQQPGEAFVTDANFERLFGKDASWDDDDEANSQDPVNGTASTEATLGNELYHDKRMSMGELTNSVDRGMETTNLEAELALLENVEALSSIGTEPELPIAPGGNGTVRIHATTPPPTPRTVTADALRAVREVGCQRLDLGARIARMERILFGASLRRAAEILCDPEAEDFAVKAALEALGTSIEQYTSTSKFNSGK